MWATWTNQHQQNFTAILIIIAPKKVLNYLRVCRQTAISLCGTYWQVIKLVFLSHEQELGHGNSVGRRGRRRVPTHPVNFPSRHSDTGMELELNNLLDSWGKQASPNLQTSLLMAFTLY